MTAKAELATLFRYAAVGGSFSLGYAIVSALLINGTRIDPFLISVGLFIACIPFAFRAQQRVAFRAEALRRNAFWMYAGTQIGSIAVVSAVTTRFVTYNVAWDTVIMGVTLVATALLSFLIGRLVIFKPLP